MENSIGALLLLDVIAPFTRELNRGRLCVYNNYSIIPLLWRIDIHIIDDDGDDLLPLVLFHPKQLPTSSNDIKHTTSLNPEVLQWNFGGITWVNFPENPFVNG